MPDLVPIPPTSLIGETFNQSRFQFILLHEFLKNSQYHYEYVKAIQKSREKGEDKYIILDNGAFELGKSLRPDMLLTAINDIKPNEVVLPDVMRDSDMTIFHTLQGYDFLSESLGVHRPKYMVVPQGKTLGEWMECCMRLIPFCETVGVSQIYEEFPGGRELLVSFIHFYNQFLGRPPVEIHLLGVSKSSLHNSIMFKNKNLIRSVDTAKMFYPGKRPVNYFLDYKPLPEHLTYEKDKELWK